MKFQKQESRKSLHSISRPKSSLRHQPRHSVIQATTFYNPSFTPTQTFNSNTVTNTNTNIHSNFNNTTSQLFHSLHRRSSYRAQKQPKQILTLTNQQRPISTSKYSMNSHPKSISKRNTDSFYMQNKEHYLGKYNLKQELGKGSFGIVYLGEDKITTKLVAIKVYQKFKINQDPSKFKNIRREIMIMQSINHPNIVSFYNHTESLTKISLTLEYCGRLSVYDMIHEKFPIEKTIARKILKQTLEALAYLHNKNIVHRDLKAQNLLLMNDSTVKLIDFGFSIVSKIFPYSANKNRKLSSICGTPNYMSPEVLRKQEYIGEYSDMWSFGILVYLMIEKRYPFRAETIKELTKTVLQGKIEFVKSEDKFLQNVVRKCLRQNPLERVLAEKLLDEDWEVDS